MHAPSVVSKNLRMLAFTSNILKANIHCVDSEKDRTIVDFVFFLIKWQQRLYAPDLIFIIKFGLGINYNTNYICQISNLISLHEDCIFRKNGGFLQEIDHKYVINVIGIYNLIYKMKGMDVYMYPFVRCKAFSFFNNLIVGKGGFESDVFVGNIRKWQSNELLGIK